MGFRLGPRAADGTRTHDLLLTKEVLYQLSYSSAYAPEDIPGQANPTKELIRGAADPGQSGRRDLNPQHLAWKARALPLSYTRSFAGRMRDEG